jgi:hypothetical protein
MSMGMTPKTLDDERIPLASCECPKTEIKTRRRSPYRFLLYLPSLCLAPIFLPAQKGTDIASLALGFQAIVVHAPPSFPQIGGSYMFGTRMEWRG